MKWQLRSVVAYALVIGLPGCGGIRGGDSTAFTPTRIDATASQMEAATDGGQAASRIKDDEFGLPPLIEIRKALLDGNDDFTIFPKIDGATAISPPASSRQTHVSTPMPATVAYSWPGESS